MYRAADPIKREASLGAICSVIQVWKFGSTGGAAESHSLELRFRLGKLSKP